MNLKRVLLILVIIFAVLWIIIVGRGGRGFYLTLLGSPYFRPEDTPTNKNAGVTIYPTLATNSPVTEVNKI